MLRLIIGLTHKPVDRSLTGAVKFRPKPLNKKQLKAIRKLPRVKWLEFGKVAKGEIRYPSFIPSIVT